MKSGASQRNGDFIEIRWGSVKWEEKESHSRRWTLREHSRSGAGKAGKPTKRPSGPPESWSIGGKKKSWKHELRVFGFIREAPSGF